MDHTENMPVDYNQQHLWDSIHKTGKLEAYSHQPSELATEVAALLPAQAKIVEIGCGVGSDAAFFARLGHTIIATDFSEVVIARNAECYKNISNLIFQVVDISKSLPLQTGEFDAIYARLSLHYFPDVIIRNIFREIHRCLKPDGLLAFMCKSMGDRLYGQGQKIEEDMFIKDGHVRHFFSEDYAKSCLEGKFNLVKIQTNLEDLYGKQSSAITVIARRVI
jgi:SAM-dependent methyltransferase